MKNILVILSLAMLCGCSAPINLINYKLDNTPRAVVNPARIKMYPDVPSNAVVIAQMTTLNYGNYRQAVTQSEAFVKKEAASLGANGIHLAATEAFKGRDVLYLSYRCFYTP